MRRLLIFILVFSLSGCAYTPNGIMWRMPDGSVWDATPAGVIDRAWIDGAFEMCQALWDMPGIEGLPAADPELRTFYCALKASNEWDEHFMRPPHRLPHFTAPRGIL